MISRCQSVGGGRARDDVVERVVDEYGDDDTAAAYDVVEDDVDEVCEVFVDVVFCWV